MRTSPKKERREKHLTTVLGRFRRDQKAATVVEFAILALPFFALLFIIIETALIFLIGQALDSATDHAARLIRTGQAQEAKFDKNSFRDSICDQLVVVFTCKDDLILDVRTSADFGSVDLSTPVINGELQDKNFKFDAGHGGDIVVVRAFYEWPVLVRFFGEGYSMLANGNYLLVSTSAFRNEPFPW